MSLETKKLDELKVAIDNIHNELKSLSLKNKEKLESAIEKSKGNVNASKENYSIWVEEKESEAFADALKIKMTLNQKLDEIKDSISEKKYESEKHKKEAKLNSAIKHAEHSAEFAIWAVEEAILAYLEALSKEATYLEEYGDDDKN
jgi:hypothetical protein